LIDWGSLKELLGRGFLINWLLCRFLRLVFFLFYVALNEIICYCNLKFLIISWKLNFGKYRSKFCIWSNWKKRSSFGFIWFGAIVLCEFKSFMAEDWRVLSVLSVLRLGISSRKLWLITIPYLLFFSTFLKIAAL
jgi:hypothetical protein